MTTREQLTFERMAALLSMIEENGATAAGSTPRPGDVKALQDAWKLGQPEEVRQAHKKNNTPPKFG